MRILPFKGLAIILAPALAIVWASGSLPPAAQEPVRTVKLMTVQMGQMDSQAEFAGAARARTELQRDFRVAGKMLRRQAEVGQRVKRGGLLAQLDSQSNQSGYSNLAACMDGTVTAVETDAGPVVSDETPIAGIAQAGPLDVCFSVPEGSVVALAVGSPAEVGVWSSDMV